MGRSRNIAVKTGRIFFFLLLLILCLYFIGKFLKPERTDFPWAVTSKVKGFYEKENNSLDVVFVGSSHAFCTFNPHVFYEEANIKSYVFAANEQPLWISYYYIKEVLKHQKPKVIVLETFYISEWSEYKKPGVNRINMDDIPFSWNKIQMARAASEDFMFFDVFAFYNYHDRWKEFSNLEFPNNDYGKLNGFTPLYKIEPKTLENFDVEAQPLPEKSGEYLQKIIELAKEEDFDLIFTYAPYNINKSRQGHILKTKQIAEENNIPFINFTDLELLKEINFNPETDFEGGHTNIYGAEKVSAYLAEYLKKNYSFEAERDFSDYVSMGRRLKAYEELPEISNLSEYLHYLKDSDFYVFISAEGKATDKLPAELSFLNSKIERKQNQDWQYVGVFQNKKNLVEEQIDSLSIIKIFPKDKNQPFHLKIKNMGSGGDKIWIDHDDKLKTIKSSAINIVVYDAFMKKVVDVRAFDLP